MVDRWPTLARVTAADSDCTILLSDDEATCRAHADGSAQVLSFSAGAPPAGNGHPLESSASAYARCPTCDRLFIVVDDNVGYLRVSHRMDIVLTGDTSLAEDDEDTAQGALSSFWLTGTEAARRFPVLQIPALAPSLPARSSIVKAELRMYASDVTGTPGFDGYKLLRNDVTVNAATWNVYKAATAWNTPGALGDNTDRDLSKKVATAAVVPGGVGWKTLLSGSTFETEVHAAQNAAWFVALYATGGSATFDSIEASNKPVLRVWYEAAR